MLSRRSALASLCALAGLALPPTAAATAMSPKPGRLRRGDTVGLIAPGMFSDGPLDVEQVKSTISGMGLVPRVAPHVTARYGYLAGTDQQRADDINAFYADQE